MLVVIIGLTYGQLPFLLSQVILFLTYNFNNYVYGLYLYFLAIKALVIFKGGWILEIPDSTIVGFSRFLAVTLVSLKILGDIWYQKPAPGVLTKLLTGTDQQT